MDTRHLYWIPILTGPSFAVWEMGRRGLRKKLRHGKETARLPQSNGRLVFFLSDGVILQLSSPWQSRRYGALFKISKNNLGCRVAQLDLVCSFISSKLRSIDRNYALNLGQLGKPFFFRPLTGLYSAISPARANFLFSCVSHVLIPQYFLNEGAFLF